MHLALISPYFRSSVASNQYKIHRWKRISFASSSSPAFSSSPCIVTAGADSVMFDHRPSCPKIFFSLLPNPRASLRDILAHFFRAPAPNACKRSTLRARTAAQHSKTRGSGRWGSPRNNRARRGRPRPTASPKHCTTRNNMDKYHIFNEIGAGKNSQVFKARQKKTVTYVAVKRVAKDQMSKVCAAAIWLGAAIEVQMMHALDFEACTPPAARRMMHARFAALKFFDWYETRINLWRSWSTVREAI